MGLRAWWKRHFGRIEGVQNVSAQIARFDATGVRPQTTATRGGEGVMDDKRIVPRPEVQRFAEAIEKRLRSHDADRGDSYKRMTSDEILTYAHYRVNTLFDAIVSGDAEEVKKQAASLGAAGLFAFFYAGGQD